MLSLAFPACFNGTVVACLAEGIACGGGLLALVWGDTPKGTYAVNIGRF